MNRWTILRETRSNRRGVFVMARCECGTEREVLRSSILNGASRSCGCLHRDELSARMTTHGLSKRPEYGVWEAMIQRCTNANDKKWADYGGRGITVCDAWREFPAFWRDMGPRPEGLTLERIDVDGNYEPSNCRWATYSDQNRNRRLADSCRNGHPFTAATTLYHRDSARGVTRRRCAICQADAQARYLADRAAIGGAA